MLFERPRPLARPDRVDRADDGVADLAGGGRCTVVKVPVEDQATTDPAAQVQVEQVLYLAPDPERRFGERDQVRVVVHQRHGAENALDPLLERELLPAGHARRNDRHAAPCVHRPAKADADADQALGCDAVLRQQIARQLDRVCHDRLGIVGGHLPMNTGIGVVVQIDQRGA